jgi:hypothetical protein
VRASAESAGPRPRGEQAAAGAEGPDQDAIELRGGVEGGRAHHRIAALLGLVAPGHGRPGCLELLADRALEIVVAGDGDRRGKAVGVEGESGQLVRAATPVAEAEPDGERPGWFGDEQLLAGRGADELHRVAGGVREGQAGQQGEEHEEM